MAHGDKTNAFFTELENLYRKHNLQLAFDALQMRACVIDLDQYMSPNWRELIDDYSVNRIEPVVAVPEALEETGTPDVPTSDVPSPDDILPEHALHDLDASIAQSEPTDEPQASTVNDAIPEVTPESTPEPTPVINTDENEG
jgi:hypothetical protein